MSSRESGCVKKFLPCDVAQRWSLISRAGGTTLLANRVSTTLFSEALGRSDCSDNEVAGVVDALCRHPGLGGAGIFKVEAAADGSAALRSARPGKAVSLRLSEPDSLQSPGYEREARPQRRVFWLTAGWSQTSDHRGLSARTIRRAIVAVCGRSLAFCRSSSAVLGPNCWQSTGRKIAGRWRAASRDHAEQIKKRDAAIRAQDCEYLGHDGRGDRQERLRSRPPLSMLPPRLRRSRPSAEELQAQAEELARKASSKRSLAALTRS